MRYESKHLFRFTVAQYHRLLELKILDADRQIELLEGILFENMPRNPTGNSVTRAFDRIASQNFPGDWVLARSRGIPLSRAKPESEPQPDYAIIRASTADGMRDVGLVVEIASAEPTLERVDLGRIYARAAISVYWILDYSAQVVEVFTQPSGPIDSPHYAKRDRYPVGTSVPIVLDGNTVGTIAVADVMG
jgi:Uma2 family endonuclease